MLKGFFRIEREAPVDGEIDAVLAEMRRIGVTDDKYPKMMEHLEKLHRLKAQERPKPVSRDTIALVLGGLAQVLLIVAYEDKHVFSPTAIRQIIRPTPGD